MQKKPHINMKFESWKVIFIKKLKSVLNVSGTLTLFAGIHLIIRNMQCLLSLLSHEVTSDSATPWTAAHQAPWGLLRLMSFESVMLSNRLILCHPLLLLPSKGEHMKNAYLHNGNKLFIGISQKYLVFSKCQVYK